MNQKAISPRRFYLFLVAMFLALAFFQLAIREGNDQLALLAGVVPAVVVLGNLIPVRVFSLDRLLTSAALTLTAFGILAVAALRPDEAHSLALQSLASVAFLLPGVLLSRWLRPACSIAVIFGFLGLSMLSVPLVMPYLSFACDMVSMLLLMVACTICMIRQKQVAAMLLSLSGAALMLLGQHPVSAIVWSLVFLSLMWACSARPAVMFLVLSSTGLLFYGAWLINPELLWPDQTFVPVFSTRPSLFGPEQADAVPAISPFSLFPALTGRYGLILSGCVVLLYPLMMLRSVSLARASRSRFHGLLAAGLAMQLSFFAIGALLYDMGIWPLQSLPMPFMSEDLPSMSACFLITGMLGGIFSGNLQDLEDDIRLSSLAR